MAGAKYGELAFLGGIVLAFIVGLASGLIGDALLPYVMAVLIVLGLVVGFMNIKEKEVNSFLMATIALLLVSTSWASMMGYLAVVLGALGPTLTSAITGIMSALISFISPAAFIVALKALYNLAQG